MLLSYIEGLVEKKKIEKTVEKRRPAISQWEEYQARFHKNKIFFPIHYDAF